jgi:hypothetical protein
MAPLAALARHHQLVDAGARSPCLACSTPMPAGRDQTHNERRVAAKPMAGAGVDEHDPVLCADERSEKDSVLVPGTPEPSTLSWV